MQSGLAGPSSREETDLREGAPAPALTIMMITSVCAVARLSERIPMHFSFDLQQISSAEHASERPPVNSTLAEQEQSRYTTRDVCTPSRRPGNREPRRLLRRGPHLSLTPKLRGPGGWLFIFYFFFGGANLFQDAFCVLHPVLPRREGAMSVGVRGAMGGVSGCPCSHLTCSLCRYRLAQAPGRGIVTSGECQPATQSRQLGSVLGLMTWKKSEAAGCGARPPCG